MDDLSGQTIKGYELRERIGAGGFGAVYKAYQSLLKREVAVKVILPEHANQPEFIRRFEVEAELVAQLEHPHIIPLFDYWREPDGAYLVMRWLRGGSLRDDLENNGAWDVERILKLLDHITAALHVAHRNGVIHRDIKPDNILLDEDGNAYLADFGIAKSAGKESKSADGSVTGSVMYAAPEQLQSLKVSPQTDIYSLGIMLYELLTGKHPFEGSTLSELIFKHLQDPFPMLNLPDADVSDTFNEILQKMVAKDPSERFADVREVVSALFVASEGESQADVRISTPSIRKRELLYLERIGLRYDHWLDLYTDMSALASIEKPKVNLKSRSAEKYLDIRHDIFTEIDHMIEKAEAEITSVESFDELREGILKYKRVALIGDPGAGKTTTLERLAYEIAIAAGEDEHAPLPILVSLNEFDGGDFGTFMALSFAIENENDQEPLPLQAYLPDRVVLLLDGLNEMQPEDHRVVAEWLTTNTEVSVIVSCRKLDYVGLKLPLQRIDVVPLDVNRIWLFIDNYLENADREDLFWALGGPKTVAAWSWYQQQQRSRGSATFHDFWFGDDKLSTYVPEQIYIDKVRHVLREEGKLPDLLDVVTNPFLLFVMIQIYARQGEPPANKGQLFELFVRLLMTQRGKAATKPERPWVDESKQKSALAALAYKIQTERTGTSVGKKWALGVMQQELPQEDAELILYFAASSSIIEYGKRVRFSHQLLQEYFASYAMREDIKNGVPATKYWPDEAWWKACGWEETAVLLAGIENDATRIVEWVTPIQPSVAYRVAIESGVDCAPDALNALLYPPDDGRRCPIACAEGGRRMSDRGDVRHGVGLDENTGLPDVDWVTIPAGKFLYGLVEQTLRLAEYQIARYPITNIQFQSFVDSGDYDDPYWWNGFLEKYRPWTPHKRDYKYDNHPRGYLSWHQTISFCRWLTSRWQNLGVIADDEQVRLPTEQEWEKAARGTDGRKYPWGDTYIAGHANIDETKKYRRGSFALYGTDRYDFSDAVGPYFLNKPTAVGMYPHGKSVYGVLDTIGNGSEWCTTDALDHDHTGEGGGSGRVLRSCDFHSRYDSATCYHRSKLFPDPTLWDAKLGGFRIVLSPILDSL